MGAKSAVITPGKISDKAVRQQLTRILTSKTFSRVDRLRRFVDFIVTESVEGRGGDLKEYVIGVQVFGVRLSHRDCDRSQPELQFLIDDGIACGTDLLQLTPQHRHLRACQEITD